MSLLWEMMEEELAGAFEKAGYDPALAKVVVSNRPDLCEFQCNGAMAGAKAYHKAPLGIAQEVVNGLAGSRVLENVQAVKPGFINFDVQGQVLAKLLDRMEKMDRFGAAKEGEPEKILMDYGGPNVAKPLHVGHLRSAIIGESIKRICRYMGDEVIGDIHLGDWGLQMGLIIAELERTNPELPYFDAAFEGEYPEEAPFTISDLEEIYPRASAKSKEDEEFRRTAMEATHRMQQGERGYLALFRKIVKVSVEDLKKNYDALNVSFDLWKGESDVQKYIPDMIRKMRQKGLAYEDQGALVVDVKEEGDSKEVPPCMLLKSDGAALYTTTDLATLVERMQLYAPDEILYIVDKRQELHFVQVFRCARKAGIVPDGTHLQFLGFGTMNGKDGKPFKTREGGVMRLENLIREIEEEMYAKIVENRSVKDTDAGKTAKQVGLAAIKYGDLSNQASKDYVFDVERFTSFEGNTGPYILYTIVRIKSILAKYEEADRKIPEEDLLAPASESEKALMLALTGYPQAIESAYAERAPHRLCAYLYETANAFNRFYHETKILSEEDEKRRASYIRLIILTKKMLEIGIDLLGFSAPERM
ncbi:MAG: arginine--tRNA ligase [Blautia sp.]|nr:arginine--tRNA ligase [Blautia sp.]